MVPKPIFSYSIDWCESKFFVFHKLEKNTITRLLVLVYPLEVVTIGTYCAIAKQLFPAKI